MDINTIFEMFTYAMEATFICCTIVFIFCSNHHHTKKIQPEDLFGMIVLICLSGLRYEVGSDYTRYLHSYAFASERFSDLHTLFTEEILHRYSYEVGYEVLSVLTSRLFSSPYAIFWIVAVILYVPLILYCRKKTNDANVAFATFMLFGFWGLSLNIMKQAIAMMLVVCIYEFIEKRKYVFAAVFTVLAISFHTTSIVAVIAIIAVHIIQKKFYIPTKRNLGLFVIVGIALRFGTAIVLAIMSKITILSKYVYYLDTGYTRINRSFIWIGALAETVAVVIILYIAIGKMVELKNRTLGIEKIISIIMIGIPLSIIGISRRLWLANRFAKYFFLFLILLVPALMGKSNSTYNGKKRIFSQKSRILFWVAMVGWHVLYSILMLDNNFFSINTYLF